MATMSREIIEAAIEGLEVKKVRIDAQLVELRGMLNGGSSAPPARTTRGGKRHFSEEALRRMREAQQRRWARVRGESQPSAKPTPAVKPKRKMSAAGRKAIAEAQRKRWAAKRAATD